MILLAALTTTIKAQNSGQSAESGSLKLELTGTTPTYRAIIKATNKQSCPVNIRFDHNGETIIRPLPAFGSDTIQITLPECTIKAKPMTNCGGGDMGWVELNVCAALPVKLEWITTRQIDAHTIEVRFLPTEISGKDFYIQLSEDGLNFKRVLIILPADLKPGQICSVKVKI